MHALLLFVSQKVLYLFEKIFLHREFYFSTIKRDVLLHSSQSDVKNSAADYTGLF